MMESIYKAPDQLASAVDAAMAATGYRFVRTRGVTEDGNWHPHNRGVRLSGFYVGHGVNVRLTCPGVGGIALSVNRKSSPRTKTGEVDNLDALLLLLDELTSEQTMLEKLAQPVLAAALHDMGGAREFDGMSLSELSSVVGSATATLSPYGYEAQYRAQEIRFNYGRIWGYRNGKRDALADVARAVSGQQDDAINAEGH